MPEKFKRSWNLKANKYQREIILVSFLPAFIIVAIVAAFLAFFFNELIQVTMHGTRASIVATVVEWRGHIMTIFAAFLIMHLIFSFIVSSNLVGAFERIIRELDQVIKGEKSAPITARTKDTLANELLSRINKLIEKYRSNS